MGCDFNHRFNAARHSNFTQNESSRIPNLVLMKKSIQIPSYIEYQTGYKRIFTVSDLYRTLVQAPAAIRKLRYNQKKGLINLLFIERLQLAVTQVNACPACSYAHAYLALKAGMDNEEIQAFLSGSTDFVKAEEAKALLFAQHFAEKGGLPYRVAFEEIQLEYGPIKARIILAALQVMLLGNIFGLPYSALSARSKGRPYSNSTLGYEAGMLVAFFLLLPFAMLQAFLYGLLGLPTTHFGSANSELEE